MVSSQTHLSLPATTVSTRQAIKLFNMMGNICRRLKYYKLEMNKNFIKVSNIYWFYSSLFCCEMQRVELPPNNWVTRILSYRHSGMHCLGTFFNFFYREQIFWKFFVQKKTIVRNLPYFIYCSIVSSSKFDVVLVVHFIYKLL